jgi:RNA polymerase sigma-70 factor, ECF subfamily
MVRARPNIVSANDGQATQIAALFRRHGPLVARWAAGVGGPGVDVEDVVQEVFLIAQRRLTDHGVDAAVKTWLFRTTHAVVRHHRRKARWRRFLAGSAEEAAGDIHSPRPTPLEQLERRENVAFTYRILDSLSDKQRTVLVLFEIEGLSGEEISVLTGVKLATVWVLLHRAREKFRERMKQERGTP